MLLIDEALSLVLPMDGNRSKTIFVLIQRAQELPNLWANALLILCLSFLLEWYSRCHQYNQLIYSFCWYWQGWGVCRYNSLMSCQIHGRMLFWISVWVSYWSGASKHCVIGIPAVFTGNISTIESSIHSDEDGDVTFGDKLQDDIFASIKNAEATISSPSSLAFRISGEVDTLSDSLCLGLLVHNLVGKIILPLSSCH
jgi:hypothetical protein